MERVSGEGVCDEEVYDTIYREHAPGLFRFLTYKHGNEAKARDTVQESFLKLWEKCVDVLPDKAKSFLFTVANNHFLNEVKKEKVRLDFSKQARPSQVDHESPSFSLEYTEYGKRLEEAINNLPEGQREVFLMNRIEKYSYKQIAEMLDVSVKAIEKRMHKALLKLKVLLHPE